MKRVKTAITRITDILPGSCFSSERSLLFSHILQQPYQSVQDSDAIYRAIQADNPRELETPVQRYTEKALARKSDLENFVLVLIQLSAIHDAIDCTEWLMAFLQTNFGAELVAKTSLPLVLVRRLVQIGQHRTFAQSFHASPLQQETDSCARLLARLLTRFGGEHALLTGDPVSQRYPIYYVAQYGLADLCKLLLQHIQDETPSSRRLLSNSILLQDELDTSPLRLAISSSFDELARLLLDFLAHNQALKGNSWELASKSVLFTIISTNPAMLKQLLATNFNVDPQNAHGKTALYIAARAGEVEIVKRLLDCGASTKIFQATSGWTPLIVALSEGHISVVDALLCAGADPAAPDNNSGWTAIDHAAFRGHITLSRNLNELILHDYTKGAFPSILPCPPGTGNQLTVAGSESVILINEGSLDSTKKSSFVCLNQTSLQSQVGLHVEISLLDEQSPTHSMNLPILEGLTNKPWEFRTVNASTARVIFKLFRESTQHIGSAVALLDNLRHGLGPARESLVRNYTIPICSPSDLGSIGTLTFSLLIVRPFVYPNASQSVPSRDALWKDGGRTKVVGHRGLKAASNWRKHDAVVINSHESGCRLGRDVQLTKDHVPVVYHDFLVSETGTDTWVQNLSLKQRPVQILEQLEDTFEFKQKGFKGNNRGNYIHEPFITLADLLSQTPDSMAQNIEISKLTWPTQPTLPYPVLYRPHHLTIIEYRMLFEAASDWCSDTFAIEINAFVDAILSTILSHPSSRRRAIVFSSFSPEVCILVSLKQRLFPILFLNDSGNYATGDIRASSLQEAIAFATSGLVGIAKQRGLVTGSYGALNDVPECAKIQAEAGLDVIIVDAVRLIVETLS
ncbi:ankyrin repeat-containing domain protein [Aspergillus heterothallicus]